MKAAAIIPARWASTRFPGKPLFPILGKPLVQHVWERCQAAKGLSEVIVATDDMRIAEAAFAFGAAVSLTSSKHQSGTDRVAEVAARLRGFRHIINVQGDEPAVEPRLIDRLVHVLQSDPTLEMVTAASPFENEAEAANPNNVKVVTARDGIYGYRRDFLARFVQWKPTPLERIEKLEQLRALEQGAAIHVILTRHRALGVDTPEDVARAEAALASRGVTTS